MGLGKPQIFSLLPSSSASALHAIHASTYGICLADTNSLALYCDKASQKRVLLRALEEKRGFMGERAICSKQEWEKYKAEGQKETQGLRSEAGLSLAQIWPH